MNIRPATLEDAPFIAPVHIASWRAAYVGIVPQAHLDALDESQFAERWRTWITTETSASIFVAEVDDKICGFASAGPVRKPVSVYDGELYAVYLAPNMQRKGIGRELFVHIAREMVARKLNHMLLWTLRQNPSTGFYERLGGSVVAEDVEEIGGESLPTIAYGWTNIATQSWR
ncbi:MAG: GNAT family N-acetyltransferase [Silvibacterium sp.]